jgi:hypothetical protein
MLTQWFMQDGARTHTANVVLDFLYETFQSSCLHHVTRHNTLIHNILSTAPQLCMSQKALGTFPEDGNVMSKHVGTTIHN